ncbi:MAG: alpha-ketoglutarate-dependent dioxygenase AlkB [Polyangiaceae bacterium]|nr:alpha-ketoglutarate-dependent dioxygenase AlkB [Myxococcales bacterium]MCB9588477.1 alpha-ketoglutarate-dependent dioxygenase AlkB [Polyangiaceae bacterium]
MRIELEHGAFLELHESWLPSDVAATLHAELEAQLSWEQRAIQLFGRSVLQPRLVAWCGEVPYRYSGQTLEPREWTPAAARIRMLVEQSSQCHFNHLLANLYRSGSDSMGFHSDNEPELGPTPQVASVSFGATRRFRIKPRERGASHALDLPHNSLLIMAGTTQHHYVHGVPKQPGISAPRLNLTFRRVGTPSG